MKWINLLKGFLMRFRDRDLTKRCKRCKKELTNPRSIIRGYGPICEKIIEARKQLRLFI